MDRISFTSTIRPVSLSGFTHFKTVNGLCKNVDDWTIKGSAIAQKIGTSNIEDCSVLVLNDGDKALLMHIDPTQVNDFTLISIEKFIKSKMCEFKTEYLQGFLIGSKRNSTPMSPKVYDYFEKVLKQFKISYSKFKGSKNVTNIGYSSLNDELVIACSDMDSFIKKSSTPKEVFENLFDEIVISPNDVLVKY